MIIEQSALIVYAIIALPVGIFQWRTTKGTWFDDVYLSEFLACAAAVLWPIALVIYISIPLALKAVTEYKKFLEWGRS